MERSLRFWGFTILPLVFVGLLHLAINSQVLIHLLRVPSSYEWLFPLGVILSWFVLFCASFALVRQIYFSALDVLLSIAITETAFVTIFSYFVGFVLLDGYTVRSTDFGVLLLLGLYFSCFWLGGWFLGIIVGLLTKKKSVVAE